MDDLISVIVPIYRVEAYLKECIESIINQTYTNLEIILVNDGSDDNCPKICDEYAKVDSRIKVIHKENGGADEARKVAILQAKGKYIGYVDSDDWIDPTMYEKLIGYAKEYDVSVVECGIIDFWGEKETKRLAYFDEGCYKDEKFDTIIGSKLIYSDKFFLYGISPYLWNKLFLKEAIMEFQLLPEPSDHIVDDIMVIFPTIAKARSVYITKELFYHYRVRENSLKRRIQVDAFDKIRNGYPEWKTRFNDVYKKYGLENQLHYFLMYIMLLKCVYVFDNAKSDEYLRAFGEINKNDKIILYGAGQCGINMENYIRNTEDNNLVCWVDKNYELLQKFYNVENPEKILNLEFDYIVISIMTEQAVNSVKKDLEILGVPNEKILWVRDEYIKDPLKLLKLIKTDGTPFI